jgi:hypothetical protein
MAVASKSGSADVHRLRAGVEERRRRSDALLCRHAQEEEDRSPVSRLTWTTASEMQRGERDSIFATPLSPPFRFETHVCVVCWRRIHCVFEIFFGFGIPY